MEKSKFLEIPSYYMVPDGKGDWISRDRLVFQSAKYGMIFVPAGELNNLASIPRFFRRVFSINGPSRPAAALHDYLYKTKGLGGRFSRRQCDEIFLEAMGTSKKDYWDACPGFVQEYMRVENLFNLFDSDLPLVDKYTAKIMYLGVRIGGSSNF